MKEGDWPEDVMKSPGKQMRSVWGIESEDNFTGNEVWSIPIPTAKEKTFGKPPTQKPTLLLERVVLASTNEGDLILDPFTGSSTTGLAAIKYGRRFIGIDTEEEYLDLSVRRYGGLLGELRKRGKRVLEV